MVKSKNLILSRLSTCNISSYDDIQVDWIHFLNWPFQFMEAGLAGASGTHVVPAVTEKQGQGHAQIRTHCMVEMCVQVKTRRLGLVPHPTVQVPLNVQVNVLIGSPIFHYEGHRIWIRFCYSNNFTTCILHDWNILISQNAEWRFCNMWPILEYSRVLKMYVSK